MFPIGSCVWTPGLWLVVLFREVTEPSEGRFSLEEICLWGRACEVIFLSSTGCCLSMAGLLLLPSWHLSAACLPCKDGLYPSSTVSHNKPSLPGVAFGQGILFQKHNHHLKSRLYKLHATTGKLKHLLTFPRTKRELLGQDTQYKSKRISSFRYIV